ncbi:hypothetical protein E2562_020780, partial [Oryza meyeriana var. granulata]
MDLADDGEAPLHGASSRMPRKVVVSLLATGHSVERLAAAPAPNGSSDREEAELAEEATESGKDAVLRMVGTSHDTVDSTEDCVPQGPSCRNAIHEAKNVSKLPKKLGNSHKKRRTLKGKTAGTAVASAVSSKRTLNRDLPDQLEVHAHRLLRDSGWIITPRRRHDRPKMAYYFVAPQREVVVISLSQAWKFCGQRLHKATGGSEWGKFPMEWSDADPFWKDLVDTMAYVGKMTENGESSLTLLRRWQLLDPFVAVIFIDKMITALQKQKTLRAVDSSTFVLDDDEHSPSENKSTLVTLSSGYKQTTIGSNEPGLCSSGSTSKKHAKAKSKPAKLIGEKRDLSLPPKCKRVTESGADKFVPVKKQQSRSLKKPSLRVSSKEVDAISNDSNEDVKSSRKRDATMLECTMPLEAKGTKKFGIKRKSENWEKHAKERPSEMHYNDDDLLITAIVKNKDISSFQKSAPRLCRNLKNNEILKDGSKYARLDYQGFYTVILEKGEEILCAASIRVHGTKAAELPFIATCAEYRRQGMCRRLISTIEEMLRTFHVKLLVLSAIPELVSTWVSGFGFKPIKENEKEQLDTINLMLFPDTCLLTKSLEGGIDTIKS